MSGVITVDSTADSRSQWTWHLGALAAVIVAILALFRFDVMQAVEVWWIYPTYSHCFLIIPISVWLVWQKKDTLRTATPGLSARALLLVPPLLLLWLAGVLATTNEVRQFAVVGLVEVAILAMLGTDIYRRILFPALYLFFLIPVGQYFIPPMQHFAAMFTDTGLSVVGVPHYTDGNVIELTNGRFEVAEACAGLRFLIATITLGVLFTHLTYTKWYKVALFLVACIIVPLIGNGFRCVGIILLAHFTDNQLAVGADHLVYGWGFNMLILAVLFFVGLRFRDPQPDDAPVAADISGPASHKTVLSLAVATVLAISVGPAFAYWHDTHAVVTDADAFARPFRLDGWVRVAKSATWQPVYNDPDQELAMGLAPQAAAGAPVDVVVEYYGRMRTRHSLIASTNRVWDVAIWHRVQAGSATANFGGKPVRFDEALIGSPSEQRLVWSAYWLDGRFTTSAMTIKLLQLKTALTGGEGAALVAFSTPVDGAMDHVRARLRASVSALHELPQRLREAGRAPAVPETAR